MRSSLLAFGLIAACGGKSPAPVTPAPSNTPSNTAEAAPTPTETADPAPPAVDLSGVCDSRPDAFGPLQLTAEQGPARHGFGVTNLSGITSSRDQPVEVCGVGGEQAWLLAATCADGSRPYGDRNQVRTSRVGSVGAGGRCGTIIDHYAVKCPEAAYDVYMDMYMCADGESF